MRRGASLVLACVALAVASPAAAQAAPGWTASFPGQLDPASTAIAADGTIVLAGRAVVAGVSRPAVQVRPPGGPLGPVQPLSTVAQGHAVVSVGPDGRFVAAWADPDAVRTAALPAGATSFGDVVALPNGVGTPTGVHVVELDDQGTAHVLWAASSLAGGQITAAVVASTRTPGGVVASQTLDQVSAPAAGSTATILGLDLATGPGGAAIAGWLTSVGPNVSAGTSTRVALRPAGQPFAAPATLGSGVAPMAIADPPRLATGPGGEIAVAWGERTYQPLQEFHVYTRAGTFAAGLGPRAEPGLGSGSLPDQPAISIASDGRVVVAWRSQVTGAYRAQVTSRAPGAAGFDPPQTFVDPSGTALQQDLAALAGGATMLVLTAFSPTGTSVGAAIAAAGAFPAATPLATDVFNRTGPFVGVSAGGEAVVAWGRDFPVVTDAVVYDAAGPSLSAVAIPASAAVGETLPFSAAAADAFSPPAAVTWSFGDGSTATGPAATHAYAAPGEYPVVVTALDALGNASTASGRVTVVAAATPPPPGPTAAPALSAVGQARAVWRLPARRTPSARRSPVGTTFRFTLDAAADVRLAFVRERPGRRVGARCVAPTRANRSGRPCTRRAAVGALAVEGAPGRNRVPFAGRVSRRKTLVPGRYVVTLVATGPTGLRSSPTTLRFRVVS